MIEPVRILTWDQYHAVQRSRAKHEDRLARRVNVPLAVVAAIRRGATFREAADLLIPRGSRVRLDSPMEAKWHAGRAPAVGEWGTATGADDAGTVFVDWDGGSNLGVLPRDRISVWRASAADRYATALAHELGIPWP